MLSVPRFQSKKLFQTNLRPSFITTSLATRIFPNQSQFLPKNLIIFQRRYSSSSPPPVKKSSLPSIRVSPDDFYLPVVGQYAWHDFLWYLILPTLFGCLIIAYADWRSRNGEQDETQEKVKELTPHFMTTVDGFEKGRYWTFLTTSISQNGSLSNLILFGSVMWLYGGNVYRTMRGPLFLGMYFGSHVVVQGLNLAMSAIQLDRVRNVLNTQEGKEELSFYNFGTLKVDDFIEMERRKLLLHSSRKDRNENISNMTQGEILQEASKNYLSRACVTSAGFLSVAVFFCLVNPYAKLPTKKWVIPLLPLTGLLFAHEIMKFEGQYAWPELLITTAGTVIVPLAFWMFMRGNIKPMKLSLKGATPKVNPAIEKEKLSQPLKDQQVEQMLKRNEKFRNRGKPTDKP